MSLPFNLANIIDAVVAIADRAGDEIMAVYDGPIESSAKADDSPLTQADLKAHALIARELALLTPQLPVLSEEGSDIPFEERAQWATYWLVDPLDGTKEFVSRNGEFTVNIALIHDHVPVFGVVGVPAQATTYVGAVSLGARRKSKGSDWVAINAATVTANPLRVIGSRSHRGALLDGYLARLGPHELLSMGSALKFCVLAEGKADLYPRLGPTSEWDTAAAKAVVEAAGGVVCTLDGERLRYNTKASLLNPHFFVYADRRRDWLSHARGLC
ncbi:MAG: 3'(2'),5'-bisphosphate nucleotidase CysQ [Candidatus Obscuribacterales bacterium]|nr:3'(2'),5'-bisphosphate nucleotidase CysQ [Steroidobacteraceae bacterium]